MYPEPLEALTLGELLARDGGSIKTGPFGTVLRASEYARDGVPVISVGEIGYGTFRVEDSTPRVPADVVSRLPGYVLEHGDIVFARKGSVDRVAIIGPKERGWFLGSDGIRLRLPQTCDARFVSYYLRSDAMRAWLGQQATGSTMASLNQSTVARIPLLLPGLAEQRAFADVLGTLDEKIELNRMKSETLERVAWASLDKWDEAAAANDGDWDSLSLGECGVWLSGGTPSKSVASFWGGDIPWISAKSLKDFVVSDSEDRVTDDGAKNGARLVPEGSVVFVVRGMSLADEFRVGVTSRVVTINQDVKAIIPSQRVSGPLIGYALRRASREVLGLADEASHGTKRLETERLKRVRIRVPLAADRLHDVDVFDLLYRSQVACQLQSKTLATLRDTLIPRLLSGEFRLRDAEREVALAT